MICAREAIPGGERIDDMYENEIGRPPVFWMPKAVTVPSLLLALPVHDDHGDLAWKSGEGQERLIAP